MKALVLTLALLAAGSAPAFAQTTLANWTFETNTPADLTDSAVISNIAADTGVFAVSSFASGVHAGAATDWSTPVGNGSVNSLSSNTWAVGDYYQFRSSTTGFTGIKLSWDQAGSNTGPKEFGLYYSTNGTSFTQFGSNYSVALSTWSSVTPQSGFSYNYDLSSVTALDNAASVYFRLIDFSTVSVNNGVVAAGGTDRVDNFTVTAIPEPSTYALLVGLAGFAAVLRRNRRCAV